MLLQKALAAHRAGRLEEADNLYRQVLQQVPQEPMALYLLGLVCFHRGDAQGAEEHISRSLARAPGNVRAWKDLGGILMAGSRLEDALHAYSQAAQHGPQLAESWHNLGVCESRLGRSAEAITHLREALLRDPAFTRSYEPLAVLLYRSGEIQGAAEVYRRWLEREPDNPKARHLAAAAAGTGTPRAPDDYVRAHFDAAADSFDSNLEQLRYRAPQLVADALARELRSAPVARLLDAGCGTGLCGPQVRALATHLTGVDLSGAMLERAAARGCYDALIEAELTAFLKEQREGFDAIICVDTLVYFGELVEPLKAAHGALKRGGLLIFTVEAGSGEGPQLEIHGRYTHGETYVRQALAGASLTLLFLTAETLREERGQPVAGLLVIARAG
jgi:predicted TPR repeat methyltransferase